MNERDSKIEAFLAKSDLVNFKRLKIPGDASFRRYERISSANGDFILMDAPPEKEDVRPFVLVDELLLLLGLSAPKIVAKNVDDGFLLLEDLGNKKFNHIFTEQPQREEELYKLAVDALAHIYNNKQKFEIPEYSREKLMQEAMLFVDWYLPLFENISEQRKKDLEKQYKFLMNEAFNRIKLPNDVMVLRDYHADNLMLLEERIGVKKVGLLDFQDALHGNVAYDLVSLLEDARRDVPIDIQKDMIEYFLKVTGNRLQATEFLNDYHILGAQRNLKILGIFSRLKVRDGKEVYLPLIPRVKAYLKQDLQHESLKELKEFLEKECNL